MFRSVVSFPASNPVASPNRPGEPAVPSQERDEWQLAGGVALSILADLDRRRPKLVVSQSTPQPKAA